MLWCNTTLRSLTPQECAESKFKKRQPCKHISMFIHTIKSKHVNVVCYLWIRGTACKYKKAFNPPFWLFPLPVRDNPNNIYKEDGNWFTLSPAPPRHHAMEYSSSIITKICFGVTISVLITVTPIGDQEGDHLLLYGVQNTPHILVNLQALQESSFTKK